MERRFTPLAVALGLAVAALLARLWDIQVLQHDVWARESANLVRAFEIDPYVRGTIRDRKGRPIVRDEEVYALEFVWREFRRGHPLGQIAMLRSLAVHRPVGLDETRVQLREAALSYASLTPDEIEEFARGGALDVGLDFAPAVVPTERRSVREQARHERRGPRASDLSFYLHELLGLSRREVKALRRLVQDVDGAGARSYLDLAGEVTDQSTADVADALARRVLEADERLARLAALIDWPEPGEGDGEPDPLATLSSGDRLISLVEEQRRGVADEAADALFTIAAGFSPTRLSAENLRRLDLEWLEVELGWDSVRLDDWIESRGEGFAREARAWLAGHTIARAKIDGGLPADRVLSAIAHAFRGDPEDWAREHAAPQDWRQVDEFTVISDLPVHLDLGGRVEDAAEAVRLPFEDPETQTLGAVDAQLIVEVLGGLLVDAGARIDAERMRAAAEAARATSDERASPMAPTTPDRLAAALLVPVLARKKDWSAEEERPYEAVLVALHDRMQSEIAALLEMARPDPGPDGAVRGVAFADAPLEKAQETRAYVLRDRGGRSRVVGGPPDIELALLVSRYQSEFAGFRVTTRTRRTPVALGPDGESPVAKFLVGKVRSPFLVEVLASRPQMEELGELQRKLVLPDEDRTEILRLVDAAYRDGETVGGFGLEAWLDRELSGEDGYVEWHGLQDLVDGNREPIYRGARDGDDVTLTLDIDLQRAAEEVLSQPVPPGPNDRKRDLAWFEAPVGAIVLARVTGEVLAAASVPLEPHDTVHPWTDGQGAEAIDRTLRRPTFQPPGSVVKPLIAAYAMERLGLDPDAALVVCDDDDRRGAMVPRRSETIAGWGAVNCSQRYGHSPTALIGGRPLNLHQSLVVSCNTYFAWLGEERFSGEQLADAYTMFGFGQPTGVRFDDDGSRGRFTENWWHGEGDSVRPELAASMPVQDRQRVGNGLSKVQASVVQVARAYAGLATGTLPQMTLVDRIGMTRVPRRGERLGVAEAHLRRIREALHEVVRVQGGTANGKGLDEGTLGFEVAVKTGSADYKPVTEEGREWLVGTEFDAKRQMRKHTWIAGWFPSRDPEYVVVVYNHDTLTTSSHGAVHVASQFLSRPEIAALLAEDAAAADQDSGAARPVEAAASRSGEPR